MAVVLRAGYLDVPAEQPLLSYQIDQRKGIVFLLGPEASAAEFERALQQIVADPAFQPGLAFLRDRSGLAPPPTDAIHRAVEIVTGMPELSGGRWAIVVTGAANYGMYRMAQTLTEGTSVEVGVFRDRSEAENWLQHREAPPRT